MSHPIIDIILTSTEKCQSLWHYLKQWKEALDSGTPLQVIVKPFQNTRSLAQNRCMWKLLQKFSNQRQWVVNGENQKLSAEDWKNLLSASYAQETVRLARGLNGGLVLLGQSTRRFGVKRMSDFIEYLNATAIELGVELNDEDFEGLFEEDRQRIAA